MGKEADIAIVQVLTDIKILLGRIETTLVATQAYTMGMAVLATVQATDADREAAIPLMSGLKE